jgi:two-component system phosphate regulon sensor histidine kinase PhoR
MVNDLLDISRMEMQTVNKEIKELDLAEIISSVIDTFQLEISKKNIKVNLSAEKISPSFKGDYDEITRMITNLVTNAIKYNKSEGAIDINLRNAGGSILLEVKDTGIGLKPEEKKKLFTEFFRANNEYTKKISGTGLGLSIVKKIIDTYSGRIEVESEFNKGTSFKIWFPHQSFN